MLWERSKPRSNADSKHARADVGQTWNYLLKKAVPVMKRMKALVSEQGWVSVAAPFGRRTLPVYGSPKAFRVDAKILGTPLGRRRKISR